MKPIVIWGTGGHARETHEMLLAINQQSPRWEVMGFLDDNEARHETTCHDLPVLGGMDWIRRRPEVAVVLGVGAPASKLAIADRLRACGHSNFPSVVHPRAWMGSRVHFGEGAFVAAGTMITTDTTVGAFATVNQGCTIGHDVQLGEFATLAPAVNLSGNVTVEQGADLGVNCCAIQGVRIGAWSICGAGATIIRDVPADCTCVGNPARVIKQRPAGWHLPSMADPGNRT